MRTAEARISQRTRNLKAPCSSNIVILLSKKGLINWYIVLIVIKYGTWQPVKFQLVSQSWNEMIFYRVFELMLPTSDKKSWPSLNPRD